ncbi:MAG: transcription termination/antitermination factor NusG [Clostridia bacterium]|nr:transcription termination/antitermination factor NusG [Clostridia bacterium]
MSDINELQRLGPRWYVAHTYSGYENKVKANLEKIIENRNLGHLIFDIRIPVETVMETNAAGVEKETEAKLLPGYVFVKMIMNDESWHVVRNIRGVTGFVGPGSKPVPLTEDELAIMQGETVQATFKVGEEIKIVRGTFEGYSGKIYDISEDGASVTVLVNTGKRDMPVKVEIGDIKLAD